VPKILVLDSSSLIFIDRRGKLELLRRELGRGCQACIPPAIARELIEDAQKLGEELQALYPETGRKLMESSARFKRAVEDWLEIKPIDYIRYSEAIDRARVRLSRLDEKPEHTVKKGDTEAIALCTQLVVAGEEVIAILEDENLKRVLTEIVSEVRTMSIKEFLANQ
jgi:hypothetical protein